MLAFVATLFAFGTLPMTFQPTINTDFSQVKIETVPGSTLEQTTAITRKVADMLAADTDVVERSEEHTSELQSLMRTSYAVFCSKKKNTTQEQSTPVIAT